MGHCRRLCRRQHLQERPSPAISAGDSTLPPLQESFSLIITKKISTRMILLSLCTFLTILSQTQANLEARFCCQEGEKLTVRSLGKDEKVAECGDYDVGTDNLNTCPGYNDKEFTLPKIQAPVGEPCCSRIKLNATGSLTEDSVVSKFPGLYEYEALDGVNLV